MVLSPRGARVVTVLDPRQRWTSVAREKLSKVRGMVRGWLCERWKVGKGEGECCDMRSGGVGGGVVKERVYEGM